MINLFLMQRNCNFSNNFLVRGSFIKNFCYFFGNMFSPADHVNAPKWWCGIPALFIMHIFEIMVYNGLLWTEVFWISHIKRYNNNLPVVLRNEQGGKLKLVNLQNEDWVSIQIADSLSLSFSWDFKLFFNEDKQKKS